MTASSRVCLCGNLIPLPITQTHSPWNFYLSILFPLSFSLSLSLSLSLWLKYMIMNLYSKKKNIQCYLHTHNPKCFFTWKFPLEYIPYMYIQGLNDFSGRRNTVYLTNFPHTKKLCFKRSSHY